MSPFGSFGREIDEIADIAGMLIIGIGKVEAANLMPARADSIRQITLRSGWRVSRATARVRLNSASVMGRALDMEGHRSVVDPVIDFIRSE